MVPGLAQIASVILLAYQSVLRLMPQPSVDLRGGSYGEVHAPLWVVHPMVDQGFLSPRCWISWSYEARKNSWPKGSGGEIRKNTTKIKTRGSITW